MPTIQPVPRGGPQVAKPWKLNAPQVRILEALALTKRPMTRNAIVATFPPGSKYHEWLWRPLGQLTPELRKEYESRPRGYPSLISLGYVEVIPVVIEDGEEGIGTGKNRMRDKPILMDHVFQITTKGLAALREHEAGASGRSSNNR